MNETSIFALIHLDAFRADTIDMPSHSKENLRIFFEALAFCNILMNENEENRGGPGELGGRYEGDRISLEPAESLKNLLPLFSAQLLSCCLDVARKACYNNQISFVHELRETKN